jgi:hypothetical protein
VSNQSNPVEVKVMRHRLGPYVSDDSFTSLGEVPELCTTTEGCGTTTEDWRTYDSRVPPDLASSLRRSPPD